jgi:ankyrin repeat protein
MGYRQMFFLILPIVMSQFLVACSEDNNLLGDDIKLFQEVSTLAKAVDVEDTAKIEKIITNQPTLINYQEPRFGQTLLIWSILNDRYKSAENLLRLGADPNLQNHDGLSALMYAAEWRSEEWHGDPKYLKLVLKYGGDPNAVANPHASQARLETPLIAAVHSFSLENLKTLVNAGADPNYSDNCKSALEAAFALGQIDMVRYLIIEKKVDVQPSNCKTLAGEDITVFDYLRGMRYPRNSREFKVKMEIVEYLKRQGIYERN